MGFKFSGPGSRVWGFGVWVQGQVQSFGILTWVFRVEWLELREMLRVCLPFEDMAFGCQGGFFRG